MKHKAFPLIPLFLSVLTSCATTAFKTDSVLVALEKDEHSQIEYYNPDLMPNFFEEPEEFDPYIEDTINYLYGVLKPTEETQRLLETSKYEFVLENTEARAYFQIPDKIRLTQHLIHKQQHEIVGMLGHELIHKYIWENDRLEEAEEITAAINEKIKAEGFPEVNLDNNNSYIYYSALITYPINPYTESRFIRNGEAITRGFEFLLRGYSVPTEIIQFLDPILNKDENDNYYIELVQDDSSVRHTFNDEGLIIQTEKQDYANPSMNTTTSIEYQDQWTHKTHHTMFIEEELFKRFNVPYEPAYYFKYQDSNTSDGMIDKIQIKPSEDAEYLIFENPVELTNDQIEREIISSITDYESLLDYCNSHFK